MSLLEFVKKSYEKIKVYSRESGFDARYNLNVFWGDANMKDMTSIIYSSSTPEEVIHKVDMTFMYSINFPPENFIKPDACVGENGKRIRERSVDWWLNAQKANNLDVFEMPENIQESKFVHPENQVVRNGKIFTPNFLRTLSMVDRIECHCNMKDAPISGKPTVLELGAGCGYFARTFSNLHDCHQYVIMDIPETLCFSYTFLSMEYPDKSILLITEESDIEKMSGYDFVLVPTCFVDKALTGKSFDLFVNTASMGEMRNEIIRYWMDFIQNKINVKYLYTFNRYLNTIYLPHHPEWTLGDWRLEENECSMHYDSNWKMLNWELEPYYGRCPYIDTLHCRYVEIMATRPSTETAEEKVSRSNKLLEDVKEQDWYRMEHFFHGGVMTARDNIIVNDTTMTGTLFKLWESIRLNQTHDNVSVMLKYLKRLVLSENKTFEETFYYEKLIS